MLEKLKDVTIDPVDKERGLLLCLTSQNSDTSTSEWLADHAHLLDALLEKYGGLLMRGFNIHSMTEFNRTLSYISADLSEYMFRSTPRTVIGGKIYTASEYPQDRHIPLHNEFSYFHSWPKRITFHCCIQPKTGGETPVASTARVYNRLPAVLRDRFEDKQVMYIRSYTEGLDLSWHEVFQTESQQVVETYCHENGIKFEWLQGGCQLRTWHIAQASTTHNNGQRLWFNQAHLFHFSSLDPQTKKILGSYVKEEDLPRNSTYGDGTPIDDHDLDLIREAYEQETVKFPWQRGDIMILDNTLLAHGRTPYTGMRKIAVGMG